MQAQSAEKPTNIILSENLTGAKLVDVLNAYENSGLKVLYTNSLVPETLIIESDPQLHDSISRLMAILKGCNLHLEYSTAMASWVVTRAPQVKNEPQTYHIQTQSKTPSIEEITVTASTYRLDQNSHANQTRYDPLLLEMSASRGSDPVQIINTLPGLTTSGISSRPHVRGGDQDEIIFLLNKIELVDPFHLKDFQSMLSGINADIVDSIDVYTGGFPAEYGGKMSGVIDMATRISTDRPFTLDANVFTSSATASGASNDDDFQWIANYRRGNLDDVIERYSPDTGSPKFYDAYLNTRWRLNDSHSLELGYLHIQDDITLNHLLRTNDESADSDYLSQYYWLRYHNRTSRDSYSSWTVTGIDIDNNRLGYIYEPDDPDESNGQLSDSRDFIISRLEYNRYLKLNEKNEWQWGGRLQYNQAQYNYMLEVQRGELANLLDIPREVSFDIDHTLEGGEGYAFASYKYSPSSRWSFDSGLRFDVQNYDGNRRQQISPRFSLLYNANSFLSFKASAGRYQQNQFVTQMSVENNRFTFNRPQKSDHYILGTNFMYQHHQISLEYYRKKIYTPSIRHQNLFSAYTLIPELASDYKHLDIDHSLIHGSEIIYQYRPRIGAKYWVSAEFNSVVDTVQLNSEYLDIDRPWSYGKMLKAGMAWTGGNWNISGNVTFRDGWKTTQLPSNIDTLDNPLTLTINGAHLPQYLSLDMRASYIWHKKNSEFELYFECYNFLDSDNIGGYHPQISPSNSGTGYQITRDDEPLLPILPSLGFTYSF